MGGDCERVLRCDSWGGPGGERAPGLDTEGGWGGDRGGKIASNFIKKEEDGISKEVFDNPP